ncbi:MAG: sensor histidine kinase [Polyangiales bacterium]
MMVRRLATKQLILITGLVTALLTASAWLGHHALQEAFAVGLNPTVQRQLDASLRSHRARLIERRAAASRQADSFSEALHQGHWPPVEAELQTLFARARRQSPALTQLVLTAADGRWRYSVPPRAATTQPRRTYRTYRTTRTIQRQPRAQLSLEFAPPRKLLQAYRRAAQIVDTYALLHERRTRLTHAYALLYLLCLLGITVIAATLALLWTRRWTAALSRLNHATQQVAAGNLRVQLEAQSRDEIGQLTSAFNRMVRELEGSRARIVELERTSAWQDIARHLAHEIKNPLTPIQLVVQEVSQSYDGTDPTHAAKLQSARRIVEEEVDALHRLVGAFSAYAKLPPLCLGEIDLVALLDDLTHSTHQTTANPVDTDPAVPVILQADVTQAQVRGDGMLLKRALENLLQNALRAAAQRPDHANPRVELRLVHHNRPDVGEDHFAFIIDDTGPGVAEEDRARIFMPYFTTQEDGSGLGLAIARKIALDHGGDLRCSPSPLGGARFVLCLAHDPVTPLHPSTPPAPARKLTKNLAQSETTC